MKLRFVILAMVALLESKALADETSALPSLGAGDPRLLVWINPNLLQFYILAYTGEKDLSEDNLNAERIADKSLKLLYPPIAGTIGAVDFQHCFPYGNGQGFLRRIEYSTKNVPAKDGSDMQCELIVDRADIVLFEAQNSSFVTKVLSDAKVNQEFALPSGVHFLGKLDNIVFYWDQHTEDTIVGRDAKTGRTYRWRIPGVYVVEGVLRGTKKDYGLVVYRRIHRLTNAAGEKAVVGISVKDAEVVRGGQSSAPVSGAEK